MYVFVYVKVSVCVCVCECVCAQRKADQIAGFMADSEWCQFVRL